MSQPVAQRSAPPSAAAPAPAAAPMVQQPAAARPPLSTPRLLRLLMTGVIVLGVVVGGLGLLTFVSYESSLSRARDNAQQLVRVQQIQTNLLTADAQATNAFLVGGLEPAESRSRYDSAIAATTRLIAEASEAQPADAQALAALNDVVLAYASTVEQARANNRQGFPIGSQYLRNASADLRADALPICAALVSADNARTAEEIDYAGGPAQVVFVIIGALGVVALVLVMIMVGRRFHRRINLGLLVATIALLIAVVVGGAVLGTTGSIVTGVRDQSVDALTTAAAIRTAGNDAKSNESLTLIARGSGASFEQAWQTRADEIDGQLRQLTAIDPSASGVTTGWTAYATAHEQIRKLDDGGNWDGAVNRVTGSGKSSTNAAFTTFDDSVGAAIARAGTATDRGLADPAAGLVVMGIVSLLLGLGAAVAAWSGLNARLKEYQ